MADENEINFATFRDCVSVVIIERLGGTPIQVVKKERSSKRSRHSRLSQTGGRNGTTKATYVGPEPHTTAPAELADFVEYLAEESFHALPEDLQSLTYLTSQENENLKKTYSLPLSSDLVDHIAHHDLPLSINDTLQSYSLINPPNSDISSFFSPILNSYVAAVTTPPPLPSSTRATATECEICERDWITLTYHHLIPRAVHAKVVKRDWHPESKLGDVAWLCRACHSFVHRMASNEELAREWWSVERILEREDVQRWKGWVGGVRWKKR